MSKSKVKSYGSFPKIAYQGWLGEEDYQDAGYECLFCGGMIESGKKKCPDCGALHKMERANLKMIRPVLVKDGKEEPRTTNLYIESKKEDTNRNRLKKILSFFKKQ